MFKIEKQLSSFPWQPEQRLLHNNRGLEEMTQFNSRKGDTSSKYNITSHRQ